MLMYNYMYYLLSLNVRYSIRSLLFLCGGAYIAEFRCLHIYVVKVFELLWRVRWIFCNINVYNVLYVFVKIYIYVLFILILIFWSWILYVDSISRNLRCCMDLNHKYGPFCKVYREIVLYMTCNVPIWACLSFFGYCLYNY
jgi:hypothetical protein